MLNLNDLNLIDIRADDNGSYQNYSIKNEFHRISLSISDDINTPVSKKVNQSIDDLIQDKSIYEINRYF